MGEAGGDGRLQQRADTMPLYREDRLVPVDAPIQRGAVEGRLGGPRQFPHTLR